MDIILDADKCTALGICESIAPDYFEIDDSGDLILLRADVDPEQRAVVEEAVRACPTIALRLTGTEA